MRRFVIGDIHGAYRALVQCFERSGFSREDDLLICLGDVCDSWPEVNLVIETLLDVKSHVLLLGNHDLWALDWFKYHRTPDIWLLQGGEATCSSYPDKVPKTHARFLSHAKPFHVSNRTLFVHGGILTDVPLEKQRLQTFIWDRSLVQRALECHFSEREMNLTGFEAVYVGHTPTIKYGQLTPIRACEITMMDTGAGWPGGVLTMMDLDSLEIFQSDPVDRLYPGERGRL